MKWDKSRKVPHASPSPLPIILVVGTERVIDVHAQPPQMLTLWCHLLQAKVTNQDATRARPQA